MKHKMQKKSALRMIITVFIVLIVSFILIVIFNINKNRIFFENHPFNYDNVGTTWVSENGQVKLYVSEDSGDYGTIETEHEIVKISVGAPPRPPFNFDIYSFDDDSNGTVIDTANIIERGKAQYWQKDKFSVTFYETTYLEKGETIVFYRDYKEADLKRQK